MKGKDIHISYMKDTDVKGVDIIMVVGGTRRILTLMKYKLKGVSIIYRLDGINWLHRKKKVGFKTYIFAEYRNFLSKIIHGFIADHIVYQSAFVHHWWEKDGLNKRRSFSIIHNGIDINEFKPLDNIEPKTCRRIICLEGTLDYSPYTIEMLNYLAENLPESFIVDIYGHFWTKSNAQKINPRLHYHGPVNRERVKTVMKGGIYISIDVNAACPNSVLEALAAGSPVVGFDTGALNELVNSSVGRIVPFGGNPWSLEKPDFKSMLTAIIETSIDYDRLSMNARIRAERDFSIEKIMGKYMDVLSGFLKST